MFNPLRELFSPKSVIGLQVTDRYMGGVEIVNSLKGPEVHRMAFREVKDPDQVSGELKEFLADSKFSGESVITALPASMGYFRDLVLSLDNPKKLSRIIKYQLEPHVPHPIEDMVVDFLLPESENGILTVGVEKASLRNHLEILQKAGIDAEEVGLDILALFYLYVSRDNESARAPVGIFYLDQDTGILLVVYQNRIDLLRVLMGDERETGQLRESLTFYTFQRAEPQVAEILITGPSADKIRAEAIEKQCGVHASLWHPFQGLKNGTPGMSSSLQAALSVPLGLALSALNPPKKKVDLRKEEFVQKTSISLKRMGIYALSASLLFVALLTFNLYHIVDIQEKRYATLRERVSSLLTETFPDSSLVVKGQELARMQQKMEEQRGQFEWLESLDGRGSVLDLLLLFTQTVSAFPGTTIENLSIEGKDIRLDGQTSSFETVDKIKETLIQTGAFKIVDLVGAKKDKNANTVSFNLALEEME